MPGSSIVTTMARNGTELGIKLAGSDEWHLTDAPTIGQALYYAGQGPDTSARDVGDSAVLELVGLGGAAAAGSPSVAAFVGGSMSDALAMTTQLDLICAGRSSRFKLPALDWRGTPLGVDVRKVVELGITPKVTTGILHVSEGTGQVGAGVATAPIECFRTALLALDRAIDRDGARELVARCGRRQCDGRRRRRPGLVRAARDAPARPGAGLVPPRRSTSSWAAPCSCS